MLNLCGLPHLFAMLFLKIRSRICASANGFFPAKDSILYKKRYLGNTGCIPPRLSSMFP